MSNVRSKRGILLVAAACAACCAIPIAGLVFAGAGSTAIAAFFSGDAYREVLVCGILILLIAIGYLVYARHRRNACCSAPNAGCTSSQCGVDPAKIKRVTPE